MSQYENGFDQQDATIEQQKFATQHGAASAPGRDSMRLRQPLAKAARKTWRRRESEVDYGQVCGRFAKTLAGLVLTIGLTLFAATGTSANTIKVTGAGDNIAVDGLVTLREAITAANTNAPCGDAPKGDPGFDLIIFGFTGAGVKTINLTSSLPPITDTLKIDGYSQGVASENNLTEGSNAVLLIELNGAGAGSGAVGLKVVAPDCVITGLVINRFSEAGIIIDGGIGSNGKHATITGCFIGTNASGTSKLANKYGIYLDDSSDNLIGGIFAGSRNLISGNQFDGIFIANEGSTGNAVVGNLIGTNKAGTGSVPNLGSGIMVEGTTFDNTIGGALASSRNIISGNGAGITLSGSLLTLVVGNYIGTNASGTAKVPNASGINVYGHNNDAAKFNKIGAAGMGNLISGNGIGIRLVKDAIANKVEANRIGTKADGVSPLGNDFAGIFIEGGAQENSVGGSAAGAGNTIANNENGVKMTRVFGNSVYPTYANAVLQNSIYSNSELGLDLNNDLVSPNDLDDQDKDPPNELQNYPVLSRAASSAAGTSVVGTLNSSANSKYRLEFFINPQCHASGYGEGKTFLGTTNVTTVGNNVNFSLSFPGSYVGQFLTATATDSKNNTSEFSACVPITLDTGALEFSSSAYSGKEGTQVNVLVIRKGSTTGAVSVHYATVAGGTATENSDYQPVSGVLSWASGDGAAKSFTVTLVDDKIHEPTETLKLELSGPAGGALLGKSAAEMAIVDDDPPPTISISDVSQAEGNSGSTKFNFEVTLSAPSAETVTVDFLAANGTAAVGSDYQASGATLSFAPGETTRSFSVPVNGDTQDEPTETFVVNLSNPINGTIAKGQGVGTIVNDDAPAGPNIQFSQATYGAAEQLGAMTITVTRSGDVSSAASVDYVTADGSAVQKSDFEYAAGTLNFNPGEVSKTFVVLLNQDSYSEGPESFNLVLSNPAGAALGAQAISQVSITDDLAETVVNPIDDAQSFVYLHYHDFLNREPDPAGLAFWVNQIASCGNNAQCIEEKRINVSAAFFLSIEFQETGYLRYLLQKESFGSTPKYAEFMRDVQEVSRDVIVNAPGWQQKLKDNQQQFADKWVNRPQFKTAYDGLSNDDYVNVLYKNAGIVPPQAAKEKLVAALNAASMNRAAVLLDVAADATFRQQEQNAAFVLMEYFGYLRRDPNAAPDSDLSGYNFWLNKLNQFGGNYVDAEMIKAFITSIEYRQRFAQ